MADPYAALAVDPYAALAKPQQPARQTGVVPSVGRIASAAAEGFTAPFKESVDPAPVIRDWILKQPPALQPAANLVLNDIPALLNRGLQIGAAPFEALTSAYGQAVAEITGDQREAENATTAAKGLLQQLSAGTAGVTMAPPMMRPRVVPKSAEVAGAFERQGVTPTAGAVSGSRTLQTAEKAIGATPGGTAVMQNVTEKTLAQTADATRRLAEGTGSAQSPQVVGGLLRQGAERAGERYARRREELDTRIEQTMPFGPDTIVGVTNIERLSESLKAELAKAPASRTDLAPAIAELDKILADSKGGVLPFSQLRKIRTNLGRNLDSPDVSGYSPGSQGALKEVYGALSDDIKAAAQGAGPEAVKALATHDRYVKYMRNINLPVLDELVRLKTDEQVYNWALAQGKIGGTRITRLRYNLREKYGEDVWDEVVSTVLSRMGAATARNQGVPTELLGPADTFSAESFLTNFSKMSEEAKGALFGGSRYAELRKDLDDLVTITASLKDAERMTNFSNTGRTMLYGTLGIAMAAAASGRVGSALTLAGGSVAAPWAAGRLITNPAFVRWLSARGVKDAAGMKKHIAQLSVIAGAYPELEEALVDYTTALTNNMPPEMLEDGQPQPYPKTIRSLGFRGALQ